MIQQQGNIQIRHIVIDIIFNAVLPNNISSNCKSAMSVCDSVVVSLQDSKSTMLDTSGMTAARPVKFYIFGPISLNRRSWRFFPLYMPDWKVCSAQLRSRLRNFGTKRASRHADLGKCFSDAHFGKARVRNVIAQFGKCTKRASLASRLCNLLS